MVIKKTNENKSFFPWEGSPFPEWAEHVALDRRLVRTVVETTPRKASVRDALYEDVGLAHPMRVFLRELCAFRWGYWNDLRASLDANALPGASPGLRVERALLSLFCSLRQGGVSDPREEEAILRREAAAIGSTWIPSILDFEACSARVRLGHYRGNLPWLSELLRALTPVSGYWAFRLRIGLATAEQALGGFASSERHLDEAQAILRRHPSTALLATLLRRRISLALEGERFDEARALYPEAIALARDEDFHTEQALLLQERLRMCITDGNEAAAQEAFSELQICVERARLPQAFMSVIEERCELALRGEKPEAALSLVETSVAGAIAREEIAGVCVGRMYQARALHGLGRSAEAAECLEEALRLAREQSYGKARVRILFYASALARDSGARVRARLLLEEAGMLAREMDLSVQSRCHHFAAENLDAERPVITPLLEALRSLPAFQELFHYLQFYGFFANRRVSLSLGSHARETRPLRELLHSLRVAPAVHWFERERVLVACSPGGPPVLERFDERFPVDRAVVYVLRRMGTRPGAGVTPEQLHRLSYRAVTYRGEVHGGRLRMLVSRMRDRLAPFGCVVVHDRPLGGYVARFPLPFVSVVGLDDAAEESHDDSAGDGDVEPAKRRLLRPREQEILTLLRAEGRLSTGALCERLDVTRQSLHPWIAHLLRRGLVRSSGHGRARCYEVSEPDQGR